MDFHQLKVFVEVAKRRSFSRAAEAIFLSQPTVSAHVKALENEIGTPLLDRSQRELKLTAAGKVLFRYAQQLLDIKEKAISTIQKEYQMIKGHLEIAASSVPGAYLLPGLLLAFRRQYPETTFSVFLRDSTQVMETVADYTYDLGFAGSPVAGEALSQIRLVEDELILVAAGGMDIPAGQTGEEHKLPPVEPELCLGLPFVMREPGSATRMIFEKALKRKYGQKINLKVVAYLESQEAIKEAVKAGLGVTIISRKAVEEELRRGDLKGYTLEELKLKRNFYLIYRRNRLLPPLSQAFLDFTVGYFGVGKSP